MNKNHDQKKDEYNAYDHYHRDNYLNVQDEEFASEFFNSELVSDATSGAVILGILGLISAISALFTYSFILGAIGIVLGCYSVSKGAKILGIITICIGLFAALFPLFYNGTFMSLF